MPRKTLKIVIAPDSFKGSLTAMEAAEQIRAGLSRGLPGSSFTLVPMADGGEGTVRAIVDATGGKLMKRTVKGPLGKPVKAEFGMSGDGRTAVIEMAAASGLALLKPRERNPMITSTYGTGELIKTALNRGVKKIVIGIGGSATNDGGTGMARALGIRFLDSRDREINEGGSSLEKLARIDTSGRHKALDHVTVEVACDVDNPLTGPRGAAQVYAPQKGASPAMVKKLDAGLKHLAKIIRSDLGMSVLRVPGAGAAGGLGAGLMAFTGGTLRPGVDIVIDAVKLKQKMRGASLVVTGEGRLDGQSIFGKTPIGVARTAKALNLPVIAIAGSTGKDVDQVLDAGIDAFFSAIEEPVDEEDLPKRGPGMLARCAEQAGRLISLNLLTGSTAVAGIARRRR